MANTEIRGALKLIKGLQAIRRDLTGSAGRMFATMTRAVLMLHRFATNAVHVDTGRLKNSLHPDVSHNGNDLVGSISTNLEYAEYEFGRSGSGEWSTPHNTLVYTHAQLGSQVSAMFGNDLQVSIRTNIR